MCYQSLRFEIVMKFFFAVGRGGRQRGDGPDELPVRQADREPAAQPVGHHRSAAQTLVLEAVRLQRRLLLRIDARTHRPRHSPDPSLHLHK
jgi:hypothetical protein